jgi:serine/threonine-protein kinase HipA
MTKSEQYCYIYIQLPGTVTPVPCATLKVKEVGHSAFEGTVTYGKKYIERENVVALDRFNLPLSTKPLIFTKMKGIPGAIRDASPDAWGRRVIQAKLQRPEEDIREMEYLLNGPDDGAGNLSFGLAQTPPGPRRPYNRTHQLEALVNAVQALEEDGRLPHEVLEELEPGTSMGGARPKVTIDDNKKIWLAKLPEKNDLHNTQRIEYATLELARAAGLRVCGTRIEKVGNFEALLLDRFDREWNPDTNSYMRHGLVSGLTALDADDGYNGREKWSYVLLADELKRWSAKSEDDQKELFRRMVFNAMVTNNDDHPRNHALLHTSGGWRLSPAYDIVPVALSSLEHRDLALTVGKFGRAASLYNLISECSAFSLSEEDAMNEINKILLVVKDWRTFFAAKGVEQRSISMLDKAILPPSFYLMEPVAPLNLPWKKFKK